MMDDVTIDNVCHMDWKRPYYLHSDVMGYPHFAAHSKLYGLGRFRSSCNQRISICCLQLG